MPQIINTNIASLNAQRNLNESQRSQETALQRLSSGLRINSASDDAAGLAISSRFESQIRGTNVAARNAGDAISLAQTAEGALDSINTSLQRIRELALQASNDTNSSVDRQALQEEVDQLVAEIQTVAENTTFNGKNLLDGSFSNAVFQTGANVGNTVAVSISQLDTSTLGAAASSGLSSSNSGTGITAAETLTAGDLVVNGVSIAAPSGTDDNASTAFSESSAIAKAAAINAVSDQTGVTATVGRTVVEGTTIAAGTVTGVAAETVTINGVGITIGTEDVETEVALTGVADAINSASDRTGVTASVVSTSTGFRVDLIAEDGRNITVDSTTAGTEDFGLVDDGTDGTATTFKGDFTLSSADGSDITLTSDTGNIGNFGFEETTASGSVAGVVGSSDLTASRAALNAGDLVINGVDVGATRASDDTASSATNSESAIALAAAINRVSEESGVTAEANQNVIYSGDITVLTAGSITVNGTTVNIAAGTDVAGKVSNAISAVNDVAGQTGVRAEALDANSYKLIADDGRNIVLGGGGAANDEGFTDSTNVGGVTLSSGGAIELGTLTGNIERAGLKVGTFGASESGTLLNDIDVTTVAGANAAVTAVDNAVGTVASRRAELGAVQNRFQSTISNLEITGENLSAANSRITDADFAAETAALSRSQVLQQAGISVLAQANARPQQVLSLLG